MTPIRDSLHGYIQLDREEKDIVDSPEMQRLRRIRQLGLSSLVYPSATHTRFQHSLGVMYLAGEFAESLDLDEERRKELRIAGLLHDSGHGPFSHASELVAEKEGISHEKLSCQVVDRLEDLYSADPRRIKKIIQGELEIGQVVAGDIDADRMDYLLRDAHSSGLEHGNIDISTVIRLAQIDSRRLVFDYKAVQALESLFTARFHMIKSLYKHHASQIAEKMLQRSLENWLEQKHSVGELMSMDDYQAHCRLQNSEGASRTLYRRITERRLYKRALVWDEDKVSRDALRSLENRIKDPRKVEKEIAETAGVEEEKVIIDPPKTPSISSIDVNVKKNGEVKSFSEMSPIPGSLKEAEWRTVAMKVYSPEEEREKVREASENILENYSNVLGRYL